MTNVSRSTLLIAFFIALDKLVNFLRQVVFNRVFLPEELDIYLTSNNIPDLLSALISGGALSIALIPVLTATLEQDGRKAAWNLFSRILNLAFLVTAAVSLIILLLAEPLVHNITAPGFPPAKQALTVELMRLDLVAILIFSLSGLSMAGLQSNQHFLLPAMAPLVFHCGQIIGAVVLAPSHSFSLGPVSLPAFGLGLHGLVYGVILGALLHLGIQIPGLLYYQFHWSPGLDLRHPGVSQVLKLMGPGLINMLCLQIYFIARDNLASHLPSGSVTVLSYGWHILQAPVSLIGGAIAIALLPTISDLSARGDRPKFTQTINHSLRVILALSLPAAGLLIAGIAPLIDILFSFPVEQANWLAWVTRVLLIGLLGRTWLELAARSFFAHQNARVPLVGSLVQLGVYLVCAINFSAAWGVLGLAIADALSFASQTTFLLFVLRRRFPGVLTIGQTLTRSLIGSVLGALLAAGLIHLAPAPVFPLTLVALAAGGLMALVFIRPEIKLLLKL